MTLSEKFGTKEEFLAYAEYSSGMNFDDQAVMDWFEANPDFRLTYTGIMQVLNTMVVPKEDTTTDTPEP